MSSVVTAIGIAVGASAAAAATVGTIVLVTAIVMVASIAYSMYSLFSMKTPGGYSNTQSLKDRMQVVRSPVESRRYIYGEVMVSGPLIFAHYCGNNNTYLYLVIALAGHRVQEIGDVYLGDRLSTDAKYQITIPGTAEQGHWEDNGESQVWVVDTPATPDTTRSLVTITKYLGTADQQADPELVSVTGGKWTANHRLQGVAYLVVKLEYNSSAFPNGIPNVKAIVKGNNEIYDPRTGLTGYTNNWALCIRDFLVKEYGIACLSDEINEEQAIAAANICDEAIALNRNLASYSDFMTWSISSANITAVSNLLTFATSDAATAAPGVTLSGAFDVQVNFATTSVDADTWGCQLRVLRPGYADYVTVEIGYESGARRYAALAYYGNADHSASTATSDTAGKLRLTRADASSAIHAYFWTGSTWSEVGSGFDIGVISNLQVQIAARAENVVAEFTCFAFVVSTGLSATEPRYTCNGTFTADSKPLQTMKNLLTAAVGTVIWAQGQYYIYPAAYRTPEDYIITEDDLAGPLGVQPAKSLRDKFNTVRGTFADPTDYWQPVDFPAVKNSVALAADGRELVQDIELLYTTSRATAQRLAKVHLEKELQGIIVNFPGKLTLFGFKPMDVVKLSISSMGWVEKEFRITKWEMSDNATINLVLREESAASYEWNSGMETVVDPAPNTLLPSPWDVPAPELNTPTEENYSTGVAGVVKTRVTLTWHQPSAGVNQWIIEKSLDAGVSWLSAGPAVEEKIDLPDEIEGAVIYRVKAVNGIGAVSPWASVSYIVLGKQSLPSDVPWMAVDDQRISFGPVSDIDIAGYEIRTHSGTNYDWGTAQPINDTGLFSGSPVALPVNLYGETTVLIKAKDTTKHYSQTAASVVVDMGSPAIANVLQQFDQDALNWPGTLTGGVVDGHPKADSTSLFWASNDDASFWNDDSGLFWNDEVYSPLQYKFSIWVTDRLPGSRILLAYNYNGAAINIQYRRSDALFWQEADEQFWGDDNGLFWNPGEYRAWPGNIAAEMGEYEFCITIADGTTRGELIDIAIIVDAPDIEERLNDVEIAAIGTRLALANSYRAIKLVNATLNDGTAQSVKTMDKSTSGPLMQCFNGGTAVDGTIDVIVTGY